MRLDEEDTERVEAQVELFHIAGALDLHRLRQLLGAARALRGSMGLDDRLDDGENCRACDVRHHVKGA